MHCRRGPAGHARFLPSHDALALRIELRLYATDSGRARPVSVRDQFFMRLTIGWPLTLRHKDDSRSAKETNGPALSGRQNRSICSAKTA